MGHIDIAEAKNQLKRISEHLDKPLLLIGGIAVNQYYKTRKSQDIDLICDYEIATELVDSLYDTSTWDVDETNEDEYRPSYIIKHKTKNYPTIKIGPKIIERESYKYLDWDKLKDEALPFNFRKEKLNNILVPSIEALCYSKLVSFLGRIEEHNSKISQDLRDVCELSNSDTFRLGVFLNMIASNGFEKELKNNFSTRLDNISGYIGESNLGKIIDIFTKEEEKSDSIREPSHINKTLLQPRPRSVHSKNKVRIAAFDLDGTLIKGIRHSWTMVWNHLKVDDNDQQRRKEAFRNNELSYLDWCKYDSEACKKHGLKESHFKEISEYDHISVTKNLREGIAKLKENGIKTAIISGGIDAFLYAMIPDADELFDEILINRFVFFPDGSLEKISATEYDWDDSKVGVVGKRRGLERICEKHNISIKDSAFTGDDLNDIEAMKSAGLKIFYCGDTREFVDKDNLPGDIVIISQNNFMNVVDRILTAPTGEQLD